MTIWIGSLMKSVRLYAVMAGAVVFSASSVTALGPEDFVAGPVIKGYGLIAPEQTTRPIAPDTVFKVAFDVSEQTGQGKVNRGFNTAARFINMHVAAGVSLENLNVAIVVHGAAAKDLLTNEAYGAENPNTTLLKALIAAGSDVTLCGQSAAARDIDVNALVEGVDVSLSAMTAHATLQQAGYSLNPF